MMYLKKDVNAVLLMLILLTCTALVALTILFTAQFNEVIADYSTAQAELANQRHLLEDNQDLLKTLQARLNEKTRVENELKQKLSV